MSSTLSLRLGEGLPSRPAAGTGERRRAHRSRVLAGALLASLLAHLLLGAGAGRWLGRVLDEPPVVPLEARLVPPPPPPPPPEARKPPPRARSSAPRPARAAPRVPPPPARLDSPVPILAEERGGAPDPSGAHEIALPELPALPEPALEPAEPEHGGYVLAEQAPAPRLPPQRIELVGTAYVGEQDFMVGTGGFRLEHDGRSYQISTLGRAEGLAALFFPGEGRQVSHGVITASGLQPQGYLEERGGPAKVEAARFDWERGILTLRDGRTVGLELPTYDRLSFIMQFYFRPPTQQAMDLAVAGTRNLYRFRFEHTGDELVELETGAISTQHWLGTRDDGRHTLEIWVAPELHYLPLRMRYRAVDSGRVFSLRVSGLRGQQ